MTKEINQLSGMLFDVSRALLDIARIGDTLKSIEWRLQARIDDIHNECHDALESNHD
jgi:hypothetical protein